MLFFQYNHKNKIENYLQERPCLPQAVLIFGFCMKSDLISVAISYF